MNSSSVRDRQSGLGRYTRIALVALAVVALLAVAALAALRHFYPPERIAAMVGEHVSNATGRSFRINGELKLRVVPSIAIEANDVSLANAEWSAQPDMLRARRVALDVSLRELLSGVLRIDSVTIENAELWLEADGAGRYNWRLAPRRAAASDAVERRATPFTLERVDASAVQIHYRNGRTGSVHSLAIDTMALAAAGARTALQAQLALGPQRWQMTGQIGGLAALLAGTPAWPLALKATTAGASASLDGSMGTGAHTGSLDAEASVRMEDAAALAAWSESAARHLPFPLEWRARLAHAPGSWRADPMQLSLGKQTLTGRATLERRGQAPLHLDLDLSAQVLDFTKVPSAPAGGAKSTAAASGRPAALFGDTPLPFASPPAWPITLALAVERLSLPKMPVLTALQTRMTLNANQLQLAPLAFGFAGGQVRGRFDVALGPQGAPRVELQLDARSMSVEALEALTGGVRRFKGGQASLDARLTMAGRTPRALAASANGQLSLNARDVALAGQSAARDRDLLQQLLDALIPSGMPRENLVLQCAVARLPLRNGVAAIDRSIAVETRQIAVSASGRIDLSHQTLSLAFQPRVKRGLDLNPGSLVELLLLEGPLEAPTLSINPRGAARQAASVGIAAATGGISLLAPVLRSAAGEASACAQAMGQAAPAGRPSTILPRKERR
ncbi:AsmA family protein [Variovorax sp. J22P168]|uniref:AsmA family protein n=1 Tax=Variovorax jilinensis TaxID=3053513 RepID=UPI002578DD9F|nr:AsmA family protein [Variovorax sp. J22P168]MDM0015660.1 AsmA family protein [Variovorax sp. J22P168]